MKKLLRCTLAALGLLCVCTLHAQDTTTTSSWADDTDTSWYSSDATSFTLTTAQQLAGLASLVNAGTTTFDGCTVTVANDIDLTGKEWVPIGQKGNTANQFKGTFTASGTTNVTISGVTISDASSATTTVESTYDGYVGFFGAIEDATISYITVDGTITGASAAGLVARMNGGTISNCVNKATVTGTGKAGGIACLTNTGYTNLIDLCSNTGTIGGSSANGGVGGILGYGNGQTTTISNCTNSGAVTGGTSAGGILGRATGYNSYVTNCTNSGAITASENAGGIFGLVPVAQTSAKVLVSSWSGTACTNSGTITATGTAGIAGGIAGALGSGTLTSCKNTAAVSGAVAGGVVASMNNNSALVNCSGGTATITGSTSKTETNPNDNTSWQISQNAGRLVGRIFNDPFFASPVRLTIDDTNGDDNTSVPTIGTLGPMTSGGYVIILSGTLHGTPEVGPQVSGNIILASGASWDAATSDIPSGGSLWIHASRASAYALQTVATYNGTSYYNVNSAITAAVADGSTEAATIKLSTYFAENVVIPEGANIILDLNNKRLLDTGSHTIYNQGTLSVINTASASAQAVIDAQTHGKAALYNEVGATATLSAGTYTRTKEASTSSSNAGGNSYYTLLNHGTLTIDNAAVTVTQGGTGGKYSSLIENGWYNGSENTTKADSTLNISAGTFTGGLNTVKNDDYGVLNITGGTFTNTAQYTLLNWNVATITDGTFSSSNAVIANGYGNDTMDKGTLTISGGTFTTTSSTASVIAQAGSNIGTVAVSGGTFSTAVDVTNCATGYIPATLTADDGTVTGYSVTGGSYVATVGTSSGTYTGYTTVQAAIDVATSTDTVTLVNSTTEDVMITSDKTATLDLNGYTFTNNTSYAIKNAGTLTITDSGNGSGILYAKDGTLKQAIWNTGTLTIEGGTFGDNDTDRTNANGTEQFSTIYNLGTTTIKGGYFSSGDRTSSSDYNAPVENGSSSVSATMTISGGTFYGSMNIMVYAWSGTINISGGTFTQSKVATAGTPYFFFRVVENGKVNISGGTFTRTIDDTQYCYFNINAGEINVSGGTFTNTYNSGIIYVWGNGGTVTITDGTFGTVTRYADTGNGTKLVISGGYYDNDVTSDCADGYCAMVVADSTKYKVGLLTAAVASITSSSVTTYYASYDVLLAKGTTATGITILQAPTTSDAEVKVLTKQATVTAPTSTGDTAYTTASLLGGTFTVNSDRSAVVYDYDLGISAITVTDNAEGTQVAEVSVKLTEGVDNTAVASRTLTGKWLVLTVTNGTTTNTYTSANPEFTSGVTTIEVPYSTLTSGTNAVTLKITDTNPTSTTTSL